MENNSLQKDTNRNEFGIAVINIKKKEKKILSFLF